MEEIILTNCTTIVFDMVDNIVEETVDISDKNRVIFLNKEPYPMFDDEGNPIIGVATIITHTDISCCENNQKEKFFDFLITNDSEEMVIYFYDKELDSKELEDESDIEEYKDDFSEELEDYEE